MLANAWETAINNEIDVDVDIVSQMVADSGLYRAISSFMFDDDGGKTFVCFGEFGLLLLGGSLASGGISLDSTIWVRDWSKPSEVAARINSTSKEIVGILERVEDDRYPLDCWPQVADVIGLTPSTISEVRCVIDTRKQETKVSPASLEATQLITVKSAVQAPIEEKDAENLE